MKVLADLSNIVVFIIFCISKTYIVLN